MHTTPALTGAPATWPESQSAFADMGVDVGRIVLMLFGVIYVT